MQNAFFKLFWFDFDRCFCTDREKRLLARSFVAEQILNLFFWPPQAFKVVPYFSIHWCPSVRETWPRSPYSRTLRWVALPRRWVGLDWSAFHRKEWPRFRVRYKSDATSIRGAWPLSTDSENWSGLGKFLNFSFHKLSISNWNFSKHILRLVRMTSPIIRSLSRRKLCQNFYRTALSVRKQTPQKTPPKPLFCRLASKTTKRNC